MPSACGTDIESGTETVSVELVPPETGTVPPPNEQTHDNEKGNHIPRIQQYVEILATQLRTHPRFSAVLSSDAIEIMVKSALVYDLGKMGIPASILYKAGPLSPEEFEVMQTHTTLGFEALTKVEATLGTAVSFLRTAKEMALYHHERWDGTGYFRRG